MVLDSVRTLVIWVVSMAIGWQNFFFLQLIGFFILITGMMLYNDIIILPAIKMIGVKIGCMEAEVTEYRDLEVEAEDSESHRDVQLSREEDES